MKKLIIFAVFLFIFFVLTAQKTYAAPGVELKINGISCLYPDASTVDCRSLAPLSAPATLNFTWTSQEVTACRGGSWGYQEFSAINPTTAEEINRIPYGSSNEWTNGPQPTNGSATARNLAPDIEKARRYWFIMTCDKTNGQPINSIVYGDVFNNNYYQINNGVDLKVNGLNTEDISKLNPYYAFRSPASAILTWTSNNATNCTASEKTREYSNTTYLWTQSGFTSETAWSGYKPGSGFDVLNNLVPGASGGRRYVFSLTCTKPDNSSATAYTFMDVALDSYRPTYSVGINIKAEGSEDPITAQEGMSVNLSWISTGFSVPCTAVGDWNGTKRSSGSETVYLTTRNKTPYVFGLSCQGWSLFRAGCSNGRCGTNSSQWAQGVDGVGVNATPRSPDATLIVNPLSASLTPNTTTNTTQLTASYDPDGPASTQPISVNPAATWTSDNPSVASVVKGLVTGKKDNSNTNIRSSYVGLNATPVQIHVNYTPIYKNFYTQLKGIQRADVSIGDPPEPLSPGTINYVNANCYYSPPQLSQLIEVGTSCRNYSYLDVNFSNASNPNVSCTPQEQTPATKACILKGTRENNTLTTSAGYSFSGGSNLDFFQAENPYQIDVDDISTPNPKIYVAWTERKADSAFSSTFNIMAARINSDFSGIWNKAVIATFQGNNDRYYPTSLDDFQFQKIGDKLYFYWIVTSRLEVETSRVVSSRNSFYYSANLDLSSPISGGEQVAGTKTKTIGDDIYSIFSAANRFTVSKQIYSCAQSNCSGSNCNNTVRFNCSNWSQGVITEPAEVDFGIIEHLTDQWIQSVGSDIRWDKFGGFTNLLPSGNKYASVSPPTGGMPGIIFSGALAPNFGGADRQASANPYNWQVGSAQYPDLFTSTHNLIPTSYRFLLETAQASGITPDTITSLDGLTHGIYAMNGPVTLDGSEYAFGPGNFIILIDGNLTINRKIKVPVGSTVVFSASGDITVNSTLGEAVGSATPTIEGLYSADGNFKTTEAIAIKDCTAIPRPLPDKRLNIAGTVIANAGRRGGNFVNNRTLCGGNNRNPSVSFIERPDFMLNYPAMVKKIPRFWQEVAP